MNGLSKMMAIEEQQPRQEEMMESPIQEGQEAGGITVKDVIEALMSGASPEELVQQGVPVELVQQAIQMLQQQQGPQGQGLSQLGMQ